MNKSSFTFFLLVILGLVAFAESQTCNSTYSCAGSGASCKGDAIIQNGCVYTNSTNNCCAAGLLCVNGQCTDNTIGQACNASTPCFSLDSKYTKCVNGTCQFQYAPGESCSVNSDCIGNVPCNSGTCGLTVGAPCNATNAGQCPGLSLCWAVNATLSQCTALTADGAACNATLPPCASAAFSGGSQCNKTCQALFQSGSGASCTGTDSCAGGYYCNGTSCTAYQTSQTTCTNSTDCKGNGVNICVCSPSTGYQFCSGPAYNYNPCDSAHKALTTCLEQNSCTYAAYSPNSCSKSSCGSQYKKAQSCGCSDLKTVAGSCGYSSYCGGFPVWAIIVIIVVAIVLVLAIVLLVFFMMRRRRQYDSI